MSDERVAIFIDGSNLYHCLQNDHGKASIDYQKLVEALRGDRKLMRAYYYNAQQDQTTDAGKAQQKFFNYLHSVPYFQVKLGRLESRPGGAVVEKGVDIALAVDILELAYCDAYDTAILVSGDADFAIVVEAVKRRGKHVENATGSHGQSRHLREACDRFVLLDSAFLKDVFRIGN